MLSPNALVLDFGCGSGRDAVYLTKAGHRVIGIDLSAGLIREAQRLHQGIDFQVMDMSELDFEDGMFDGVWSKLAIFHVERDQLPGIYVQCCRN
jgi:SAM-dependent methyltransferase